MKDCIVCKKEILDDSAKYCNHCGSSQDVAQQKKQGVIIITCAHCGGGGNCKQEKTLGVKHACESCAKKAGISNDSPFPQAPCGVCDGVTHRVIDLKMKQEGGGSRQNRQQQGGKYYGKTRRY